MSAIEIVIGMRCLIGLATVAVGQNAYTHKKPVTPVNARKVNGPQPVVSRILCAPPWAWPFARSITRLLTEHVGITFDMHLPFDLLRVPTAVLLPFVTVTLTGVRTREKSMRQ